MSLIQYEKTYKSEKEAREDIVRRQKPGPDHETYLVDGPRLRGGVWVVKFEEYRG